MDVFYYRSLSPALSLGGSKHPGEGAAEPSQDCSLVGGKERGGLNYLDQL